MTIEIGQPVPSFKLPYAEKAFLSLEDLKGQKAVLYFYPKDSTPGCTIESKDFQSLLPHFTALGTQVIGISKDSLSSHQKFSEKQGLTFPLLADTTTEMCQAFGVLKEKSMFGKKYMGIVRSTFFIDEEGCLKARWLNVKVSGHAAAVLKAVEEAAA